MCMILAAAAFRHDLLPVEHEIWNALIVAFVITAAVSDVRWKKIPRWATVAAAVAGVVYHIVFGGIGSALLAMVVAFVVGMAFFQVGAIGGGDVKLITALGALLGWNKWLFAMGVAILVAALIGVLQAIQRGMLKQMLLNMLELLKWIKGRGAVAHPSVNVKNPTALRAPFGLAAALGTVCAIWKP
jgi:prepilin peptidase CpaA